MSSPTWDSIFTTWETTTFEYTEDTPSASNELKIFRTASPTDKWSVGFGDSPLQGTMEVGGVVNAVLDILSNSEASNINTTELTTGAVNLPQATIEDIAVTTGTSITGDSIILLKINGSTYRILADKI